MTRAERLREAYFSLRQTSGLGRETAPFECQPWITAGKTQRRDGVDGSKLLVYEIEDGIEVCLIAPDGMSKTFA